jgi:ribulose-phosphate 3-epimerase
MCQSSGRETVREISASVLAADLADLDSEIGEVAAADRLHLDLMDGRFVPNITLGFPTIEAIAARADLPLDVHAVIEQPERYADRLASMDVASVTVHYEATDDLSAVVRTLEAGGVTPGVAISPGTEATVLETVPDSVTRTTVMSVEPGFGGQEFMPEVLDKVECLDDETSLTVEIDGGIDLDTARRSARAGVDIFVSGSTIFGSPDRAATIAALREAVESAGPDHPDDAR